MHLLSPLQKTHAQALGTPRPGAGDHSGVCPWPVPLGRQGGPLSWSPAMEAGHGVEGLTPLMQEGPEATLRMSFHCAWAPGLKIRQRGMSHSDGN